MLVNKRSYISCEIEVEMCLLEENKLIFVNRVIESGIRTIAPPRKIVPRLGLGFVSRLGLVLGLGATRLLPPVRVRVWVRVSIGVGSNFSWGICPRTIESYSRPIKVK